MLMEMMVMAMMMILMMMVMHCGSDLQYPPYIQTGPVKRPTA